MTDSMRDKEQKAIECVKAVIREISDQKYCPPKPPSEQEIDEITRFLYFKHYVDGKILEDLYNETQS
jgi:hypothetical protein